MVTIVMPTINSEHLQRAVDSVLAQTSDAWQLIVMGDGVEPKFDAHGDPNIITTKTYPHHSAGLTRNVAVSRVDTDWVGFLDDDDVLCPEYVELFHTHWEDSDVVVFKMNNYGSIIPYRQILRYGNIGMNFCCRTELCNKFPFIKESPGINEDWEFIRQLIIWGVTFEFIDYLGYLVKGEQP